MTERLITGYIPKEKLLQEVEANMVPGELVMVEDYRCYQFGLMEARYLRRIDAQDLQIAPGPSFYIERGNSNDRHSLGQTDQPVLLKGWNRPQERIQTREAVAVGNEAVSEFFSYYCHGGREWGFIHQQEFLQVAKYFNIMGGEYLTKIKQDVAGYLVGRVLQQVLREFRGGIIPNPDFSTDLSLREHQQKLLIADLISSSRKLVSLGIYGDDIKIPWIPSSSWPDYIAMDDYVMGVANLQKIELSQQSNPENKSKGETKND